MTMSSNDWDERYQASDLVWSAGPNVWVEKLCAAWAPGSALDLAGGEGRNSIWLVSQGWQAHCVDFSSVALDRATQLAAQALGEQASNFTVEAADLLEYDYAVRGYDLVMLSYVHLPEAQRAQLFANAAKAVAPGGRLLVVAHHADNRTDGVGGPQNADVLYSEGEVQSVVEAAGLETHLAERALRRVGEGPETRNAVDVVYVGRRAL